MFGSKTHAQKAIAQSVRSVVQRRCFLSSVATLAILFIATASLPNCARDASRAKTASSAKAAAPTPSSASTRELNVQQPAGQSLGTLTQAGDSVGSAASAASDSERVFTKRRLRMVAELQPEIHDTLVIRAMEKVPRHKFVARALLDRAYEDTPLPIGYDQTISAPSIVGLMTELAKPRAGARALDIGTGSGYQAAVLAELVAQVYSIEILCPLADEARERLSRLGYNNIEVRCGDGYRGWPEHAPFDIIILAAAPDHIPPPLIEQLAPGGRLVLPVGETYQELIVVEKSADGSVTQRRVLPVRFVPMTGEAEDQ